VVYYAFKNKLSLALKSIFVLIMVGIWFGAVYTSHHYVLDVVAGIVCAVIAIYSFQWFAEKNKYGKAFVNAFIQATYK
jgi:inositol phosphorylceramide synthase catalytic subunit